MAENPFDREAAAAYLISALTRDRFVLYCQPIVQVEAPQADQRFFEVLVRFRDEEEGLLPPGSFIPVLQEAGLMPLLDRWVVATAIRKLRSAGQGGGATPRFSINLSAEALVDDEFPEFIAGELAGAADLAQRLMLEIPLHETARATGRVRRRGVRADRARLRRRRVGRFAGERRDRPPVRDRRALRQGQRRQRPARRAESRRVGEAAQAWAIPAASSG